MRMKTFLIIFGCVVIISYFIVMLSSASDQNDSIKTIVTRTHHHIKKIHEDLVADPVKLEIDPKYLGLLGFTHPSVPPISPVSPSSTAISPLPATSLPPSSPPTKSPITLCPNYQRFNFTIVSYVLNGQAASAISLIQNIASNLPNDILILYDIGLSVGDSHALNTYCNRSKCIVLSYDLSPFPAHIKDDRMHAFRPILIKDALNHSKSILFLENYVRIRSGITTDYRSKLLQHVNDSGVFGWTTRLAVSSRTHPKMFEFFQTDAESFIFLPMISMDAVLFADRNAINEKILLPWIKCVLTPECIHPIGAQSGGCRFNKKPIYRYSGCHAYDVSAFNIVLGLTWNFDETKYSIHGESNFYYLETLEQATKMLESRRKNSSDTSDHMFPSDE